MKKSTPAPTAHANSHLAWLWAPALCFGRGLMLVSVMLVAMMMLKRNGQANSWASFVPALMLLPFVLRGVIRPLVLAIRTWRWLMPLLQVFFIFAMMGVASALGKSASATYWWFAAGALCCTVHDMVAADLCTQWCHGWQRNRVQACLFCAILAVVLGFGGTLILAGDMEVLSRQLHEAWSLAFHLLAAMITVVALICALTLRPSPQWKKMNMEEAWQWCRSETEHWWLFRHQRLYAFCLVLLTLHEWMIWWGVPMFLVDPGSIGGLSMGPQEVGYVLGTLGVMMLVAGCVAGYWAIGRHGLRRWLWPMVMAALLPDVLLVYLAFAMPSDIWHVFACLGLENFCCGFGMAGILTYIMYYGHGRGMAAHADIYLSLFALSAMVAGVATGFIQDYFGYRRFFIVVVAAALVAVAAFASIPHLRRK